MNYNKLVITAINSISSVGIGSDALAEGLSRTTAMTPVKSFEFHQLDAETPCFRVRDFDPAVILGKTGLRTKDLATKLLLATMEGGFKDRFAADPVPARPGIAIGTAFGSIQSIGDFLSDSIVNGVNAVNPMLFANTVINAPTGNANIRYEVKTLSATVSTGFNAAIDALIYACDHIRCGYLSAIIAGGLEEISYYALLGMERSGALSKSGVMKPFAKDSDGAVMGEGCALFCIETEESAQAHGAPVIAEIAGYCSAFDPNGGAIGFNPEGEGARFAINGALDMAGINAKAIDFIAANGNGMQSGDTMESAVIKDIFGDKPVCAYKTKTGECYGASSALSLACAVADMKNRRMTATGGSYEVTNGINLCNRTIENTPSEYALINAFTHEGNCACMVIKNRM